MNRKLFVVASATALLFTGCGSAATPASAPDVTPIASSSATPSSEASSVPETKRSDRGNAIKEIGQTAWMETEEGDTMVSFVVKGIKTDIKCNMGYSVKPDNGHLIAVKMDVDVKKAFADPDNPGLTFPTDSYSWKFVSKNGTTFNGDLGSDASINCLDDKETLPSGGIGPAQKATGLVVLDVPATTGTLIFDIYGNGGWEYELMDKANA